MKECVTGEMFFAAFSEDHLGYRFISGRWKLHMQQAGHLRIDRSGQPEPFVIKLHHGLADHNVIQVGTICGL
jgi:hypothetical protein